MSSLIQYNDNDVIDLNRDDYSSNDGRSSSQHCYRISLDSIDDDVLKLFRRDLVTPVSSVFAGEDINNMKRNMIRSRFVPPSRIQRPISRGESVLLFKKINNGDADVTFDDLVSGELRDFADTDFLMDGIVGRTTTDKNTSETHDIFKFPSTVVSLTDNEYRQQLKHQRTMLPSKLRSLSTSPSVPESLHSNHNTYRQFHPQQQQQHYSRDGYLYKQNPKKSVIMIPKKTPSSRDEHVLQTVATSSRPHKSAPTYPASPSVPVFISTRRQTQEPARNYERKSQEPGTLNTCGYEHPETARFMPRKFIAPHQRSIHLCRTRSDTTASSSSEDELKEEPAGHYPFMPSHHRTYASQPLTFDHYNNNAPLFHRYNNTMENKSVSNARFKTMAIHKAATTTTNDDVGVIDSARQLLACIKERRKRMNMGTL